MSCSMTTIGVGAGARMGVGLSTVCWQARRGSYDVLVRLGMLYGSRRAQAYSTSPKPLMYCEPASRQTSFLCLVLALLAFPDCSD